jgi:hypothetical protein
MWKRQILEQKRELRAVAGKRERGRVEEIVCRPVSAGRRQDRENVTPTEFRHGLLRLTHGATDHARDPRNRRIHARSVIRGE